MKRYLNFITPALLAAAMTAPAFAQVSTTPAAPGTATTPAAPAPGTATMPAPTTPPATTAPAAPAAEAKSCADQFTAMDTNSDGILTENEAPSVFARSRVDGKVIAETGYTRDDFLAACDTGSFDATENDEGAPLEGANSFTEDQAKDRAISRGFSDIGELTKDDKGIWRGTAMHAGATVSVAIDYKGNVVSTAP